MRKWWKWTLTFETGWCGLGIWLWPFSLRLPVVRVQLAKGSLTETLAANRRALADAAADLKVANARDRKP